MSRQYLTMVGLGMALKSKGGVKVSRELKVANDYYRKGKYQESLKWYKEALKENPRNEIIWNNIGVTLRQLGHHEEAIKSLDKALKINNKYVEAWVNKALSLGKLRMYKEALTAINNALKVNPRDKNALTNKGNILVSLG